MQKRNLVRCCACMQQCMRSCCSCSACVLAVDADLHTYESSTVIYLLFICWPFGLQVSDFDRITQYGTNGTAGDNNNAQK